MHGTKEYDVIQTLQQGEQCHIVLNHISGRTLEEICGEDGCISKEDLYSWMDQILSNLEQLHRCRPPHIYQLLTPYTIVIDKNDKAYLLDTEHESNREVVQRHFDKRIQNAFFPEESMEKRRPGISHDLFSVGRLIQYMMSKCRIEPEMSRREENRLYRMTRKIVSDNPKQRPKSAGEIQEMLARCRKKKCELPERTFGKKNSSFGRWKKYAAVAMAILVAAVGIQTMFSRMEISRVNAGSASGGTEKELEYGSASGVGQDADGHDDVGDEPIDDMSAEGDSKDGEGDSSSESGTFTEEVQSYAAQLNESLGLLYFQRLQEYETSLEYFEAADFPDENGQARINAYKTLARYYVESAAVEISDVEWAAEKLRAVLDEMPEETSAIQKLRFQLDLVRCYDRIQNTDKELQMIEECLSSQTEWESEDTDYSLRRELKEKGTTLYKAQSNWEKAIVLQKELLEHAEGTEDYENACLQLGELYFLNQQFAEGEALSLEGAGKCSNRAAAAANYAENVCGNPENDKAAKEEKITAIVAKVSEVTENEKFQKLQQEHRFSVENGKIIFE